MSMPPDAQPGPRLTFDPPIPRSLLDQKRWTALIAGGTFDPPHVAHIRLADAAAQETHCNLVIFIPAAQSPHKNDQPSANGTDRLAMLKLAALSMQCPWTVCDHELRTPGNSYTVKTLEALRKELGEAVTLRLLMGSDQAKAFSRWKDPQRILMLSEPAVVMRDSDREEDLGQDWAQRIIRSAPRLEVSATEIRRRLAQGQNVREMLSPEVEAFIRARGLYGAKREGAIP